MSSSGSAQANELAQAMHLLTWLDEEHRRDKAEIAKLQQRIEAQATEIADQARRLQELESRLTGVQAQQARVPEFTRGLELVKKELLTMIESLEEERHRAEREAARLRLSDVEAQSRSITELRKRIEVLPELADKLETRYAEDRRLSQEVVTLREKLVELGKGMSDWPRRAAFLEEQRVQDTKRIAQLQQEMSELFKRLEPYPGRFELLDEQLRRLSNEVEELRGQLPLLTEKQTQLSERYLKDRSEVNRQLSDWAEALRQDQQQMERHAKELRTFREAHDEVRRTLENLSQLEERMGQESRQVAEAQRVAEERQRHEWEKWQEGNDKRWSKHEMEQARVVTELHTRVDEMGEHISDVIAGLDALHPEVERLWRTLEGDAEARLAAAQERLVQVTRLRENQQVT